jgi:hypothetical protein
MRKSILIIFLFFLVSCDSSDDNVAKVNQDYLNQLLGFYELKDAYTENPIDLNGDGFEGTSLLEEIEYCNMSKLLDSYWCTVVDRGSYQKVHFDISVSDWSNIEQSFAHCLRHQRLSSDIIIKSMDETVLLDTKDYQLAFMLEEHRTKILDFTWEDRVVYLKLEQKLMLPTGEWQTVIMNLEYEWVRSET